jgi:porphobilinogen synthase
MYPGTRLRRLRQYVWLRDMVAETTLSTDDLILPVFVREDSIDRVISKMPGVFRHSLDELPKFIESVIAVGIRCIALFPVVNMNKRDAFASEAQNHYSLLMKSILLIRKTFPELGIITDVALDAYTSHGHDGLLSKNGLVIDNDASVNAICKHALLQAHCGATVIAPSDMMDGRIGAVRAALDKEGFHDVCLMSYSAKFSSAFYGPFRDALDSASCLQGASKATYHMDPRNSDEAIREVELDIKEHADMIMIKPGSLYLDILYKVVQKFSIPTFAFHVSGEYSMLCSAANAGFLSYEGALMETMIAFKRAGASGILSYGAIDAARIIRGDVN